MQIGLTYADSNEAYKNLLYVLPTNFIEPSDIIVEKLYKPKN